MLRIILLSSIAFFNLLAHAQVKTILVKPSLTDIKIKTFNVDSHRIYFKSEINPKGILVYLPASFHLTSSAEYFCHTAANAGYIVISLAYPGTDILYDACAHNTTLTCFEDIHREIIEGKNYNPFLVIDSTESILYRLQALIAYLKGNDKNLNWQEFLDERGNLKLANTSWAGHSDAAGHVAVLAKYNTVKRIILLSGPKDFSEHFYIPPLWMSTGNWKTDKSNIYAFGHGQDEYAIQQEIWDSLGLKKYGKTVNINQVNYPYNNSHQLITSANVAVGDRHFCTILDNRTILQNGIPLFEPVWKYLLDVPLISTAVTAKNIENTIKIYPNPLKSGVKLKLEHKPDSEYLLLNIAGVKVQSGKLFQMQTHNLTPGLYFIKLKLGRGQYATQRLIVY